MRKGILLCGLLLLSAVLHGSHDLINRYESTFCQLPEWDKNLAHIEPYGHGCTNQNYLLHTGQQRYFVRLAAPSKQFLGLYTAKEYEIIQLAATIGITPPVLLMDSDQEIMILPFITGVPINLHDEASLSQAMALLRQFHDCKQSLSTQATPEKIICFYLEQIETLQIPLTSRQNQLIAMRPTPALGTLVPCHMDFKGHNLLDDGTRLWLIDWEYAGMSDPLFEFAQLASCEEFNEEELENVLQLYYPNPSDELRQRFKEFQFLADLRWALWCLIQSKISALDRPYVQWAEEVFNHIEQETTGARPMGIF